MYHGHMITVQHASGEFFQAPEPTRAQGGRDARGLWGFLVRDALFRPFLLRAVLSDNPKRLDRILRWGGRANTRCAMGAVPLDTLLNVAISLTRTRCVEVLLSHGADARLPSGSGWWSPLCTAVLQGDKKTCQMLLSSGARWTDMRKKMDGTWSSALCLAESLDSLMPWARESDGMWRSRDRSGRLDEVLSLPIEAASRSARL